MHFDSSQFEQGRVDRRKKLKWNAIPTRFPHRKVSVKKARKPRRQQPENTLDSSLQLTNVLRDHTYTAVAQQNHHYLMSVSLCDSEFHKCDCLPGLCTLCVCVCVFVCVFVCVCVCVCVGG